MVANFLSWLNTKGNDDLVEDSFLDEFHIVILVYKYG